MEDDDLDDAVLEAEDEERTTMEILLTHRSVANQAVFDTNTNHNAQREKKTLAFIEQHQQQQCEALLAEGTRQMSVDEIARHFRMH
jgi:hypothetical protein